MAAEKKSVANFVNLFHLLMKEFGMPKRVLNELVRRAYGTSKLESFQSVKYWKSVTADFYALEQNITKGPFKLGENQRIIIKPQVPDLNQPAPESEEPFCSCGLDMMPVVVMQDHDKDVEVEATVIPQRTQQKRKVTKGGTSGVKRVKVTEERARLANITKERLS